MVAKQKVYADKFFGKMKPGIMGDGFVGINQEGREGKVKPLFPTTDQMLER
jgi:hypothetical protein